MEISELYERMAATLRAERSFGPASEHDGVTLVPVALVAGGGGGGDSGDAREGSGGGHGGVSWPLGVYVIKDGDVRWVPALDATRVALGALAVVKVALRLLARARSHR